MQRWSRSSLSRKPLIVAVLVSACLRTPEKASGARVSPPGDSATSPLAAPAASAQASARASISPTPMPTPAQRAGGTRSVPSTQGMVVAVEERAARIGANVLSAGGNAVDAAIATAFALAVTHPSAASLGGGGFALVRPLGGPTSAIDFRETAPKALTRSGFDRMIAARAVGKAAVGVPGVVAGIALMHARFATRPLAELIGPALALARDGHALGPYQAKLLRDAFAVLKQDRAVRGVFAKNGSARAAGSLVVQADLAWTLSRLISDTPEDFYRGQIAERLAAGLAPEGPSLEDLRTYRAVFREPLRILFRDYVVETMPPPSAGGVALVGTLLVLGSLPVWSASSVEGVHALLEAERRAQLERRLHVVDPEALAPHELERRRAEWQNPGFWLKVPFDPAKATASQTLSPLFKEALIASEHTTHFSVADKSGMAVSWTTTLSASFGAKIMAAGTGMVLNNSVGSFSGAGENLPVAGRRTTSSMAPTLLLTRDQLAFVLGTPGGDTIPSTLSQIVRRLVDEQSSLADAVEAPRFHHGFVPDVARYEPSLAASPELLRGLQRRGHRLKPLRRPVGDANCILMEGAHAVGYADSREPGIAVAAEAR